MKKIIFILISIMSLLLIAGCNSNSENNQNINLNQGGKQLNQNNKLETNQHSESNIYDLPTEEISNEEKEALDLTINDEYRAEAIYQKVLDKFGDVKPFSNIINAEKKHSDSLEDIYEKYNLEPPINDWANNVPEFDSITEACEAGIDAEIENAALYDGLFEEIDNQDIITVFTSLRDASIEKHLPAFERCAGR